MLEKKKERFRCPKCGQVETLLYFPAGRKDFEHQGKTIHSSWKSEYWCHYCNKIFKVNEVEQDANILRRDVEEQKVKRIF